MKLLRCTGLLDHAQTLAIVLPALLRENAKPSAKIITVRERVWHLTDGSEESWIECAIEATRFSLKSWA